MTTKTKAKADPDTILVRMCNRQRTSLGDYTDGFEDLPADEARRYIQQGLAVRVEVAS